MRKGAVLTFALSAAFFLVVAAQAQPPGGEKGPGKGDKGPGDKGPGGKGGPGGFGGGFMRGQPGQIMPVFLQERLKLTDDQKKAVADLQKEVETKLDKMLTDEQRAELKKLKEAGPGGFPGGPGGPGGRGGNPPPKGGDKKE